MEAWELAAVYIQGLIRSLGSMEPVKNTTCLAIPVQRLNGQMANNYQKACERQGFQ